MTAHTRTASLAPGFMPATTAHTSTSRLVVIAASFLLEAVIVLGFVSSSVGLGAAPYPDPDHGWASPAPSSCPLPRHREPHPASGAPAHSPAPGTRSVTQPV